MLPALHKAMDPKIGWKDSAAMAIRKSMERIEGKMLWPRLLQLLDQDEDSNHPTKLFSLIDPVGAVILEFLRSLHLLGPLLAPGHQRHFPERTATS